MLKVMLIGGTKTDLIIETLGDVNYNIVKSYGFVEDAFNDMAENSGEFIDIDVVIVLQYGIKSDVDALKQITSFQELLVVCGMTSKLYFILKDKEQFAECGESENVLVYDYTRILYMNKIHIADITRVVQGEMDGEGLFSKKLHKKEEKLYTEEVLEEDEKKPKHFTKIKQEEVDKSDKDSINKTVEEKDDDGGVVKKSKKLPGFLLEKLGRGSGSDKSSGGESYRLQDEGERGKGYFKGVIAVTGDRNMGVTSTAANLAEYCAGIGKTVLLVDLDIERKALSLMYPEFKDEEVRFTNTQLGLLTVLNNPDMIEDAMVIVKDNLALISSSRSPEFQVNNFANKSLDQVINNANIITFLGVAKGLFDVIVIDFPLEQLENYIETSIMVDKFVVCMENTLYASDNFFSVGVQKLIDRNEALAKSILDKVCIVLTKFSDGSRCGDYIVDEEFVGEYIKENIYGRLNVIGRITYKDVFYVQALENRRALELDSNTFQEVKNIMNNICLI